MEETGIPKKPGRKSRTISVDDIKELYESGVKALQKEPVIKRVSSRFKDIDPKEDKDAVRIVPREDNLEALKKNTSKTSMVSRKATNPEEAEFYSLYPSPDNNPIFLKHWKLFLPDIAKRDNFKVGHLSQLRVLCELYVECQALTEFIRKNGFSMKKFGGRHGDIYVEYPEVKQLNKVRAEIRMFSKILGLLLVKDTALNPGHGNKEDWGEDDF